MPILPVDSGCTVTNINHDSIVPAERRMTASRPISVATINSEPIFPDYEGYGTLNTFSADGNITCIRMGRCIRAPTIKNLLSVSSMALKGHECMLNEKNPRMICKDGTVVPMYFFNNLFYLPYVVPTEHGSSGSHLYPRNGVQGRGYPWTVCLADSGTGISPRGRFWKFGDGDIPHP